jgi:hypothetical protein
MRTYKKHNQDKEKRERLLEFMETWVMSYFSVDFNKRSIAHLLSLTNNATVMDKETANRFKLLLLKVRTAH